MTEERVVVRAAGPDDASLLWAMLIEAVFRSPQPPRPSIEAVQAMPELAAYVRGFGRPGDFGVVADAGGAPVGAAWCRQFPPEQPGYGFVDASVPELVIAVAPGHRGGGIGRELLAALIAEAVRRGLSALSLSVTETNPAAALYRRAGFRPVGRVDDALTMLLELGGPPAPQSEPGLGG